MMMPDRNFPDRDPYREDAGATPPDDATLIARIQAGDEAAFVMVMGAYVEHLTRFAYTIVRSVEAADDVVQTAFFQLWKRRAALDRVVSLRAYLFWLTRNCAVDERRTAAARARHQDVMDAEILAETVPVLVASHEGVVLDAAMLDVALQRLAEQRRLAIRLRFDGQLSLEEIGEVLDISAEAARKLVSRALQDLREILGVSG